MVYFVGAGAGAKDLITLRGKSLLETADVIIYAGSLVNKELLDYAKKDAQIYDSASMTLEEVTDVMIEASKFGKTTVRLHTGDQSLFGAVREQMDILLANNVEFASVPGVSSFCAAAAAINAEFTLPDVSQTVILTRMQGRTSVPEREDIEKLAAHQASMVIFLSASMIEELAKKLINGGYSSDTPAAIIYKASWEDEKKIVCTIKELCEKARENNITNHALIFVGEFLGENYSLSKLYDKNFEHGFRKSDKK